MKVRVTIVVEGEIGDDLQCLANLKGEADMIGDSLYDTMFAVGVLKIQQLSVFVEELENFAGNVKQ